MTKLNYLDFKEAIGKSLQVAKTRDLIEFISIKDGLRRTLSQDIKCIKNMPSFDNSAMDGYAIKQADAGLELRVKKIILAGQTVEPCLEDKTCYKIMTGAKVPSDADSIVPLENIVSSKDDLVLLPKDIKKGSNKRLKGEEQAKGNILLKKGQKLNSSHIAMLSAQGLTQVEVYKKISIAIISTGSELKEPWENASEDEIYNCNSYALISFLESFGFDATYAGVIPDDLEQTKSYIAKLKNYDVIISSGGISLGDADFVESAFRANGLEIIFHGINVKPGKPTMVGKMDKSYVLALPGNPLTAMVNAALFLVPVLNKIQGNLEFHHDFIYAKNKEEFKVKANRTNVVLGNLLQGEFIVTRKNKYGSGMLSPLLESNCIVITGQDKSCIESGVMLKVLMLDTILTKNPTNIIN